GGRAPSPYGLTGRGPRHPGNHEGTDKMLNKYMAAGVVAATVLGAAGTAQAGKDLDAVKARGQLICGVSTGVAGFAQADSQGKWARADVRNRRPLAPAIFGRAPQREVPPDHPPPPLTPPSSA